MLDQPPKITIRVAMPHDSPEDLAEALRAQSRCRLERQGLRAPDGVTVEVSALPQDGEFADVVAGGGGPHRPTPDEVRRMREARAIVCLTGPGGSIADAQRMLAVGADFVRCGGAGILVDNSGATHGGGDWLKLAGQADDGVHWAFVITNRDTDGSFSGQGFPCLFSTGMHCMGHRDVVVPATGDDETDWFHVNNYCGYLQNSGRIPVDGDVLTALADPEDGGPPCVVPMFRVRYGACTHVPPEAPMHNPYGYYVLTILDPDDPEWVKFKPSSRS